MPSRVRVLEEADKLRTGAAGGGGDGDTDQGPPFEVELIVLPPQDSRGEASRAATLARGVHPNWGDLWGPSPQNTGRQG